MQNGLIERFYGSSRRRVRDLYAFRMLADVREHTEQWLRDYNEAIPHGSLEGLTLVEGRERHLPETSSYTWT